MRCCTMVWLLLPRAEQCLLPCLATLPDRGDCMLPVHSQT